MKTGTQSRLSHRRPSKNSTSNDLRVGLIHHRAGRLSQASARYAKILKLDPRHADALNLMGVLARQRGDLPGSERFIARAIHENGFAATYFHNLGRTYFDQDRKDEAVRCFERALTLNPDDAESMQHLAGILAGRSELARATEICERWVAARPDQFEAHMLLGFLLEGRAMLAESAQHIRRASALAPEKAELHLRLAGVLVKDKQLAEALPHFREGLKLSPEDEANWNLFGMTLHQLRHVDEARQAYLSALRLNADFPEALSNLGALLTDIGKSIEAEAFLRRAVQLDPKLIDAYCNLGTAASRRGEALEAIGYLRKVLEMNPTHAEALCTLGYTFDTLGDDEGAVDCFRLSLQKEPESAIARFNLSPHMLGAGNFAEGWRDYELRWKVRMFGARPLPFTTPQWKGEDVCGSRIYIYAEQGLGDTLQFIRYGLLLVERGAQVILQVQPLLMNLLKDLHPSIQVVCAVGDVPPTFDWHCALMSLPGVFGTELSTIPNSVPYLRVGGLAIAKWLGRINGEGLRVGLVWSGNPQHTRDRLRSLTVDQIQPLTSMAGVTFYSLQKDPRKLPDAARQFIDLDAELENFTDTAAVIQQLDVVIAADTAVAHLAGAMGKPVWIFIPQAADWRWLKNRNDSPWYPSARLFRQTALGHWDEVVNAMRAELEGLVARRIQGGAGSPCESDKSALNGVATHG